MSGTSIIAKFSMSLKHLERLPLSSTTSFNGEKSCEPTDSKKQKPEPAMTQNHIRAFSARTYKTDNRKLTKLSSRHRNNIYFSHTRSEFSLFLPL